MSSSNREKTKVLVDQYKGRDWSHKFEYTITMSSLLFFGSCATVSEHKTTMALPTPTNAVSRRLKTTTLEGIQPYDGGIKRRHRQRNRSMIVAESRSRVDDGTDVDLSDTYTEVMQERMGAPLVYRHEDGMNYTRILDDLIVGSCVQTSDDVSVLENEGVTTVMCLQENSDMEYFSLDVEPIRERCASGGMIDHIRHAIRDFDPYSLRRRLPEAVALIAQNAQQPGHGTTYVHCTAGLGRAPATALGYMWWVKGIPLDVAYSNLTSLRPCKPREDAIREAAVDMLYGKDPVPVTISLRRRDMSSDVKIAGIDVGWGQSVTMVPKYVGQRAMHMVRRHLPPGRYQFKFIWVRGSYRVFCSVCMHAVIRSGNIIIKYMYISVQDDDWGISLDHLTTVDGDNVNNLLIVPDADLGPEASRARNRIRHGGDLTAEERDKIMQMLLQMPVDKHTTSAPADLRPCS